MEQVQRLKTDDLKQMSLEDVLQLTADQLPQFGSFLLPAGTYQVTMLKPTLSPSEDGGSAQLKLPYLVDAVVELEDQNEEQPELGAEKNFSYFLPVGAAFYVSDFGEATTELAANAGIDNPNVAQRIQVIENAKLQITVGIRKGKDKDGNPRENQTFLATSVLS